MHTLYSCLCLPVTIDYYSTTTLPLPLEQGTLLFTVTSCRPSISACRRTQRLDCAIFNWGPKPRVVCKLVELIELDDTCSSSPIFSTKWSDEIICIICCLYIFIIGILYEMDFLKLSKWVWYTTMKSFFGSWNASNPSGHIINDVVTTKTRWRR